MRFLPSWTATCSRTPLLVRSIFFVVWLALWLGIYQLRSAFESYLTLESLVVNPEGLGVILIVLLVFLLGYFCAQSFSARFLLLLHIVAGAILIATPPLLSSDIYLYAARGRLLGLHGFNPYEYPVSEIWSDPITDYIFPGWLNQLQPYGPVWTSLSALLCWVVGEDIAYTIVGFKLLGLLGTLFCFFALLDCSPSNSEQTRKSLYLFAANPLVLIDSVNNAHNDIWMLCGILFAIRAIRRKQFLLVLPYLALASLIKVPAIILIPFAFRFILQQSRDIRPSSILLTLPSLLLAFFVAVPYFSDAATLHGLLEVSSLRREYAAFLGTPIILFAYLWHWTGHIFLTAEESLLWGRCVFVTLYCFFLFRRIKDPELSFERILFLLLALAATVFLPWYALWVAVMSAARGKFLMTYWWSSIGLLAYYYGYTTAAVLLVSAPVFALCWIVARWRGKRTTACHALSS